MITQALQKFTVQFLCSLYHKLLRTIISPYIIGMRAAYSFKHPLKSDSMEFCGFVAVCVGVSIVFQNASSPAFLVRLS